MRHVRWTRRKIMLVGVDAFLLSFAYLSAFWLRLGWEGALAQKLVILETLPIILCVSLPVHLRHGLFNAILKYASLDTAVAVGKSVVLSVLLSCVVLFLLFRLEGVPRSIFIIYGMGAVLLVGGVRLTVRLKWKNGHSRRTSHRVLLYGAGDSAELVLRGLRFSKDLPYLAVGLIDDDPSKHGRVIHGVTVHGGSSAIGEAARHLRVDEIWVCVRNLPGHRFRKAYDAANALGAKLKILPRLRSALLGQDLGRFREPDITHLLRRPPRNLDRQRMWQWVEGRRVLITGAGGSIGSELARQISKLEPESLALCDASELNLFTIHGELSSKNGTCIEKPHLVDVTNTEGVRRMFEEARPQVVFHTAAYKHVPLVELNPCEGVLNNVGGLYSVAKSAVEEGVEDFVFISTDKAVRPASVMGATKRLGERIIQVLNKEANTRFCAVRFGNVLGSSGSVVPIFLEQIRCGGPVTVTHPEMTRYFMLISEAVELVIQSGSVATGGEIFILDMGAPVRVASMARDLIRLMGRKPGTDIRIHYTGTRPGEKIREELLIKSKDSRTTFQDIWIDGESSPDCSWRAMELELEELIRVAGSGRSEALVARLSELVPGFLPNYAATRSLLRSVPQERLVKWAAIRPTQNRLHHS